MISRYSVSKVRNIFSDQKKYEYWLQIEIILLRYLSSMGLIKSSEVEKIASKISALPEQIREEEKKINHDVAAFVNCIARTVDSDAKKWIHFGLTSSDIVDTGNSLALRDANQLILDCLYRVLRRLKRLSYKHKKTYYLNRKGSGIKGVSSFGHTLSVYYSLIKECIERFDAIRLHVECVSLSGSVGTSSYLGTEFQEYAANELNLFSVPISTQVVSRDRYFSYFSCLGSIGQAINNLCLELRLLTKTEIQEIAEGFDKNQIGSSSMPHKKNPITLENICGLYRLLEGYLNTSSNNSLIWFERDISHSSVDRVLFLDAITIVVQMMKRMVKVLNEMVVNKENMASNIQKNLFLAMKPSLKKFLFLKKLVYTDKEADFYLDKVNKYALDGGIGFQEAFSISECAKKVPKYEIERLFNFDWCFDYLDGLFKKIFGDSLKKSSFDEIYYESSEIDYAIDLLAEKLNYFYRSVIEPVMIISFREGCNPFLSKILFKFKFRVEVHTMNTSLIKYWRMKKNTGHPESKIDFDLSKVKNKYVLILDELIDTGTTIGAFKEHIMAGKPKNLVVCALFYSESSKLKGLVDFFGLSVSSSDRLSGFGMDIDGQYRNLKFVGKIKASEIN